MKRQGLPVTKPKFQASVQRGEKTWLFSPFSATVEDISASKTPEILVIFLFQLFHQEESFSGDKTYKLN